MPTILVVDDAAADRVLVKRVLTRQGTFEIVESQDGASAIEQLQKIDIDLVLTDLQMPGMGGLELVSWVKKRMPLIPTVLMTAQGSEETAAEALLAGASSYVPKGNMLTVLTETVQSVLSAAASQQAYREILRRVAFSQTEFHIETDLSVIRSLLQYLRQIISTAKGIPESEHVRIGVALEEAILNAYYHGNLELSSRLREGEVDQFHALAGERARTPPYCDRIITVEVVHQPDQISFRIHDEGHGFDLASLPDPTNADFLTRPHGRGVMLMRTFFDHVQFNESGNEVTLTKQLTR